MHKINRRSKSKLLAKLSSKLDNPDTTPKTYWSIINRFLNNKKIPIIPPVLFEGKLISDFEKKILNFLIITLTHNVLWSKMHTSPCWFSLNDSEAVKAVTLAFCGIQ